MASGLRPINAAEPVGGEIGIQCSAVITAGVEAADGKAAKLPTVAIDAYNGGTMRVYGYYHPVVIDLAGSITGIGKPIPVLRDHDSDRIVGHGVAVLESTSLKLTGTLTAQNDEVKEITTHAAGGFPWQASIGLQPTRLEKVDAGATVRVNGMDVAGPAVVVRAGKLREVSIVAFGADDSTATSVAAKEGDMGFDAWLKANGFDPATLTDAQRTPLLAAYNATLGGGSGGGHAGGSGNGSGGNGNGGGGGSGAGGQKASASARMAELLAGAKAREEREEKYAEIIAAAIQRGVSASDAEMLLAVGRERDMTATEFELYVLREGRALEASYGRKPTKGGVECSQAVIECAIAQTAGVTKYEHVNADGSKTETELYSAELQQQARDQFPQGLTLMELMVKAARRSGYVSDNFRVSKSLMQAAFAPIMARGASTYDLSGVLSNVANKSIVAGFNAVENTWREVSAIGSVTDFKEVTHYALTGDFVYDRVANGGELKHATMGEQSYGNKAETYGKIFAITRTDFINDDLSAFSRVRTMLGRGAALKLNLVFWTEFLANVGTFYTTARKNYIDGATSNLGIPSLSLADQAFLDQVDPDGHPLGISPSILLVPNALSMLATSLTVDREIRDNTASKVYSTSNPHAGKFRAVRSSYLNNSQVPGGSALAYYLLANPDDLPVIEVVFLNGQQMPVVEAAEADFDILGVQMRGYHDFGARKQEYRGGVRVKGEA